MFVRTLFLECVTAIGTIEKHERKLNSASRSLYTLAVKINKFKNSRNDIPNSIRQYVKKDGSYNMFDIIFPPILRLFLWQLCI